MRVPRLCRHKASARPYATDPRTHKPVYFGAVGSWPTPTKAPPRTAQDAYESWLGRFLTRKREIPGNLDPEGLTVAEMLNSFHDWALTYYRRADGSKTSEPANIEHAISRVFEIHAATLAADFGPLALKQVRQRMVDAGLSRGFINDQVDRIRRGFKWAVENELVPPAVYDALKAVKSLSKGRTPAPDPEPVRPVPFADVEKTLAFLTPKLRALVQVHLWCGMRAEEAVGLTPAQIDRSALPWCYRPAMHKTAHREQDREIWIGPQARAILEEWAVWTQPKRPVWLSKGRGPHFRFIGHVTVSGYRQAVESAARKAKVPAWTPRQLRKTWLTHIRHSHERGIEAAQVIGGHAEISTTEIYASANRALGRDAAERFG